MVQDHCIIVVIIRSERGNPPGLYPNYIGSRSFKDMVAHHRPSSAFGIAILL